MERLCSLFSSIFYGKVGRRFYRVNRREIDAVNYRMLQFTAPAVLGLSALCVFLSCRLELLHPMQRLYLWLSVFSLVLIVLTRTLLRRRQNLCTPAYYAFAVIINCSAVCLDTFESPQTPAAIFFTTLIVTPVLILDMPVRPMLLSASCALFFCVSSACSKRDLPIVMETDFTNLALVFCMGLLFTYFIQVTRLQSLQSMHTLRVRAERDPLTGLTNKSTTEYLCRLYLRQVSGACAMLVIDVDNFKSINDRFGHQSGDAVLHEIGCALREVFRKTAVVGRIGGDEFLVMMWNVPSHDAAVEKAEELLRRAGGIQLRGVTQPLTCSIGLATAERGVPGYHQFFSEADGALYTAKRSGKGRCVAVRSHCASRPSK